MNFGKGPPVTDISEDDVDPITKQPILGRAHLQHQGDRRNITGRDGKIHLSRIYMGDLNDHWASRLLETTIHEGLHFTRPAKFQVEEYKFDHDYIVPETMRRHESIKNEFLQQRNNMCPRGVPRPPVQRA